MSIGAYDGAEVCELVGTYTLHVLSEKYNKNDFELYHDDGLAVLKNKSGPQSEQVKKNTHKIFKEYELEDIIIQCNMKIVNYLDETGIDNCNCRNKDTCPLPNSCQTKCII